MCYVHIFWWCSHPYLVCFVFFFPDISISSYRRTIFQELALQSQDMALVKWSQKLESGSHRKCRIGTETAKPRTTRLPQNCPSRRRNTNLTQSTKMIPKAMLPCWELPCILLLVHGHQAWTRARAGSVGAVPDIWVGHMLWVEPGLLGAVLQAWTCPAVSFSTDPTALWSSPALFLPQKVQIYKAEVDRKNYCIICGRMRMS